MEHAMITLRSGRGVRNISFPLTEPGRREGGAFDDDHVAGVPWSRAWSDRSHGSWNCRGGRGLPWLVLIRGGSMGWKGSGGLFMGFQKLNYYFAIMSVLPVPRRPLGQISANSPGPGQPISKKAPDGALLRGHGTPPPPLSSDLAPFRFGKAPALFSAPTPVR